MRPHAPALIFLCVLLLLIGGGMALSRSAAPRLTTSGDVLPAAASQPRGGAQGQPAMTAAMVQLSPATAPLAPTAAPVNNNNTVAFLQWAPAIHPGTPAPHGPRGDCQSCHRMLPPDGTGGAANAGLLDIPANSSTRAAATLGSPSLPAAGTQPSLGALAAAATQQKSGDALPFQEGHWQGIEAIALTAGLARVLKIPQGTQGVVIDEVTYPADEQGFAAGDVITSVGDHPTPDLRSFIAAADRVRDEQRARIAVLRGGSTEQLQLTAPRLGNAVGETAPMIPAGSVPPHGYMGPCTSCHRIGSNGNLPVDLGDLLSKAAPPIRPGQPRPHLDRGRCTACHQIVQ